MPACSENMQPNMTQLLVLQLLWLLGGATWNLSYTQTHTQSSFSEPLPCVEIVSAFTYASCFACLGSAAGSFFAASCACTLLFLPSAYYPGSGSKIKFRLQWLSWLLQLRVTNENVLVCFATSGLQSCNPSGGDRLRSLLSLPWG